MKRVLITSDKHCGSTTGLTPLKWHRGDHHKLTWDKYTEIINKLKPVDILVDNGDLIDGLRGDPDSMIMDINEQQEMAAETIDVIEAKNVIITAGTDAHTGYAKAALELERQIIDKIKNRRKYDSTAYAINYDTVVDRVRFNLRHFTGGKGQFQARSSTGGADAAWDLIKAAVGEKEKADVIVRSHVHYFNQYDNLDQFVVTTPSLQLPGSRYAQKKCNGIIHWGLVYFDIEDDHFNFEKQIVRFPEIKIPEYKF